MTATKAVTAALKAGRVNIDPTRTTNRYSDGVCWILLDSYTTGEDPGGEIVTVIAIVEERGDLDTFVDKVFNALAEAEGVTPINFTARYSNAPFPQYEPGDYCEIEVLTNRRRRIR